MTHAKINNVITESSSSTPAGVDNKTKLVSASMAIHRRQAAWQIVVPLFGGVAIILGLAGLAVAGTIVGNKAVTHWSEISTIFIVIPIIAAAVSFLVLFAGLIYLFSRLLQVLPRYTLLGQNFFQNISNLARMWSDRIASPIMGVSGFLASIQAFWRGIFKH